MALQKLIRRLAIVTSKPTDKNPQRHTSQIGEQMPSTTKTGDTASHNGKAPQALDRWFDDQLNQLFNEVSSEPLPADLASLIGQLKSQNQK
jgi:hypothetical protein